MAEEINTSQTVVADDEMPMAPADEGSTEGVVQVEVDGSMDAEVVNQAAELGEPIPAGVYHFALDSYERAGKPNEDGQGPDPYFKIKWVCKDPKYNGRVVFDNVTWVRAIDMKKAKMGDEEAKKKVLNRLVKIKAMQQAGNFKPQGSYDVMRDFLDKKPELKLQIRVKERMQKDESTGKYTVKTGIHDNDIVKYVPLLRQA